MTLLLTNERFLMSVCVGSSLLFSYSMFRNTCSNPRIMHRELYKYYLLYPFHPFVALVDVFVDAFTILSRNWLVAIALGLSIGKLTGKCVKSILNK